MTIAHDDETLYPSSYLGDGVTASFDGYYVWLRTPRFEGTHEVALEPPVLETLDLYLRYLKTKAKLAKEGVEL